MTSLKPPNCKHFQASALIFWHRGAACVLSNASKPKPLASCSALGLQDAGMGAISAHRPDLGRLRGPHAVLPDPHRGGASPGGGAAPGEHPRLQAAAADHLHPRPAAVHLPQCVPPPCEPGQLQTCMPQLVLAVAKHVVLGYPGLQCWIHGPVWPKHCLILCGPTCLPNVLITDFEAGLELGAKGLGLHRFGPADLPAHPAHDPGSHDQAGGRHRPGRDGLPRHHQVLHIPGQQLFDYLSLLLSVVHAEKPQLCMNLLSGPASSGSSAAALACAGLLPHGPCVLKFAASYMPVLRCNPQLQSGASNEPALQWLERLATTCGGVKTRAAA